MTDDLRRLDDERFAKLDQKIDRVSNDVGSIRDMLISEPEASPMGRALLRRSTENRSATDQLRRDFEKYAEDHQDWINGFIEKRFDPMYDWWNQQKGSWKAIQGLALILATVGAFFGILAYWGVRP